MTELCRLCGKHKCFIDMVIELQDEFQDTKLSCKEIIKNYCHVQLDSNKLLPQSVCDECKEFIDKIISFRCTIQSVQIKLKNNQLYNLKECFVQLEKIGELSNFIPKNKSVKDTIDVLSTPESILISSQDVNFFEINQYELDSDFDEQLENVHSVQSKKLPSTTRKNVLKPETVEEIFENELNGTSSFPILRYSIPQSEVLENGEITENGQTLFSSLRWNTIKNKCEIANCSKSGLDSLLSLRFHHEVDHDIKEVTISCPLCTKSSFKRIYGFINHMTSKHLLEHLKFCCIVCSTMFNDLVSLLKHNKLIHSNTRNRNISQCLICGHHSDNMGDLKNHRITHKIDNYMDIFHSELNIKIKDSKFNLQLLECFKNSDGTITDDGQSSYMKWQDFNFTCKLCPLPEKSFNFMEYYLHCSTEHSDNKEPKYICSDCPEHCVVTFSQMPTLVTHQITCHNKDLSYCCIVCSKMFWNYKALDTHYKYFHICYKAYLCLICGRHFAQRNGKGHLINHAIVEHKLEKIEQLASIEQLDVKEIHQMDQRIEKESFVMRNEIKVEENISSDEELKSESMKKKRVQQTLYGDDVDTVEKLFDSEIAGTSIYAGKLHLNVSMCNVLSNGELTNDGLEEMDVLRWKDLLCCSKCKFNCVSIIKLKKHIAQNHARSFHALVCGECDDCSYHNETPWLNHVVSKHYEHLKLCCLICSQMLYDFHSLLSHYKTKHKNNYKIYPCLICGFYCKTFVDLKEHKASHMSRPIGKTVNLKLTGEHYKSFSKKMDASLFCTAVPQDQRLLDGNVLKVFQDKVKINWDYMTLDCSECPFVGNIPYELIKHNQNKHPVIRNVPIKTIFNCKLCKDKDYNNIVAMISHGMHRHDNCFMTYTCIVCTKMFWNFVSVQDHYRDCHSTFKVSVCLYCGRIFDTITLFASHLRGHKLTINATNDYKCGTCNVIFNSLELFKMHECKVKRVFKNNTSQICPTCGKSFMSRGTLSTHIKSHAPPEEPKTCEICLKVYPNKYKLKQHSITHNLHIRPFSCKICGMTFKMKNLLKRHTMVHTGERPYPCTSCDKRFATPYDLRVHARLHTGDFPYECAHCDARYPAWSNLYKHSKSKHNLDIRSEGYKQLIASRTQPHDNNYSILFKEKTF